MARKPKIYAWRIDQEKIDAPNFPRDLSWWKGFMPTSWVMVCQNPDGSIYLAVEGKARAQSLGYMINAGMKRLLPAITEVEPINA